MAGTLTVTHTTGATVYGHIFAVSGSNDGKIADVVAQAFDAYATGDIADYDLPLTELGTASQVYQVAFPAWIAAGIYRVIFRVQSGGSPAETDTVLESRLVYWGGASFVDLSEVHAILCNDVEIDHDAGTVKPYDDAGYAGGAGTARETLTRGSVAGGKKTTVIRS